QHRLLPPPPCISPFFSTQTASPQLYPLSLHDALPISVSNQSRCFNIPDPHRAVPLHHNHTIGSRIINSNLLTWHDRQFLSAESVRFITDPFFDVTFCRHFFERPDRHRCHKTVFPNMWIYVEIPINDGYKCVEIAAVLFRSPIPE